MRKRKLQHAKALPSHNGDEEEIRIEVPEITYQLPREDIHAARMVWCIDIGTHVKDFGKGPEKQRQVILGFELPGEKAVFNMERGEEPFLVPEIYKMSLHERSKLYSHLLPWRGQGELRTPHYNLGDLIGQACLVNVIHKPTKKNQLRPAIISISSVPKGMRVPPQITPTRKYLISHAFGGCYNNLPAWVQKFIDESEEIGGVQPSKEQITERNVREATTNAQESRPHPPVEIDEPASVEVDEPSLEELERSDAAARQLQADVDDLTR